MIARTGKTPAETQARHQLSRHQPGDFVLFQRDKGI